MWKKTAGCWPSLGLAYIASVLEHDGHRVAYIDCSAEHYTINDMRQVLKDCKGFDYIGLTATTPLINNALRIADIAKQEIPGVKVVVGGVHASVMPDEVLSNKCVDFVAVDEGEQTIRELINGARPEDILGLCFKKDGQIIKNDLRPLIKDLDEIPPPAYHLMPIKKYYPAPGTYKRLPVMTIFSTRGCPGRCTFCYRCFRGVIRKRSAKNIIEEVKILQKDYGIKGLTIVDDTFTIFKDVVKEFCNLILSEGLDISWSCMTRVDCVNEELLKLMKRAGCFQILFGVESGDEEILKAINKKISLTQVQEIVKLARKIGIETRATFMFGNQGETEETIKKTIDFAIKLDPDMAQFNIAIPYPGTYLFDWAKERGYIKSFNWDDYNLSDAVLDLPGLSRDKLQYYYRLAHRKFFFRPKWILRRALQIRNWAQIEQNVKGLFALLGFVRLNQD